MGAQGTTTVDFGSTGSVEAVATVTGQAGITGASLAEAWIWPVATATHTADEHRIEEITVRAGNIVAGVGFTIWAHYTPARGGMVQEVGGRGRTALRRRARLRGVYTVAWAWN